MDQDLEKKRDYLLGKTGEAATEQIDLAILSGAISRNALEIAENELIEQYLDGELDEDDRTRFREHFLVTEARRQMLDEIVAIRYAARKPEIEAADGPASIPGKVGIGVFGYVSNFRRSVTFAFAAALLVVVGLAVWYAVGNRGSDLARLEARYAELNRSVDPAGYPAPAVRTLFESRFRDGGEKKLRLAEFAGDPLFLLAVPPESASTVFDLTVERNGRAIFNLRGLTPVRQEVRAVLPREIPAAGPFVIRLDKAGTKSDPILYEVRVE